MASRRLDFPEAFGPTTKARLRIGTSTVRKFRQFSNFKCEIRIAANSGSQSPSPLLGDRLILRLEDRQRSRLAHNGFGFLLPCRMQADARKLKEDAPEESTVSSKPVLGCSFLEEVGSRRLSWGADLLIPLSLSIPGLRPLRGCQSPPIASVSPSGVERGRLGPQPSNKATARKTAFAIHMATKGEITC